MNISYICTRKRNECGKPCEFTDMGPSLIEEIDPNSAHRSDYVSRHNVDKVVDNTTRMCTHVVNTHCYPTESRGMNHVEGGWPASVDNADEDSMARFRKKIEKDKAYTNTVKSLCDFLEHFIMENNSINIYEEFYDGEKIDLDSDSSIKTISVFADINADYRSITDISWTKDSNKFAAAYSLKQQSNYPIFPLLESYMWDIKNNVEPIYTFNPEIFMSCVECSPNNADLVLSGYINGQVALWDIRIGGYAQQLSNVLNSHVETVTGLTWLCSDNDVAFVSSSTDSKLCSWDGRNLSLPIETIYLDPDKDAMLDLDQRYTINCLEYDVTMPNKFMVGTEQGIIISFNRKYKRKKDILSSRYNSNYGPLLSLKRNSFFPQLFASCDAWTLKLWSEGVSDSAVLNVLTKDGFFSDFCWSPTRASTMYVTKTTGTLQVWDLPGKNEDAMLELKVENEPLLSVSVNSTGDNIACGGFSGSVHLLSIPSFLKQTSELEQNLVKGCIREADKIIGGKPKSDRIANLEDELSISGVSEDLFDPPEKAQDLYEEYQELFKGFLNNVK